MVSIGETILITILLFGVLNLIFNIKWIKLMQFITFITVIIIIGFILGIGIKLTGMVFGW